MKLLLIYTIYVAIVKGNKLEPYQTIKCQSRIRHVPAIQTVILDFDENFNVSLKTCMIKNANSINSVVLINNNYTRPYATLERCKTDDHPTIVIITKQITSTLLDTPSVRGILRSQRSVLTIAVTDEKNFTCRNDSMTTNDFLYLEAFMNELWHKFKIAHVSISFPLSCYGKLAVYSNKRNTNQGVYDRTIMIIRTDDDEKLQEIFGQKRIMLTEGYPLKANIFERIPTSTRLHCDKLHYYNNKINLNITDGYCGLDAFVMHTIVEHFKFKLELVRDKKCDGYGYDLGTNLSGSLGCISRKELDISFNSRFMTMYSSDEVYFLHFVTVDSLCVMVKQADVIPIWLYGVIIYTPKLWLIILSLHVFIGFFWWITSTMNTNRNRNQRKPLLLFVKDAFTTIMFGFTKNYSESRLVKGICLFSSIMFLALYQGHINHIYTTLVRYRNINKLAELFKSDLVLHVTPSILAIMKQIYNKENEDERNFINRMIEIPKNGFSLDILLKKPNTALAGRRKDMHIEIFNNYTTGESKQPLIHIMNECLRTYYLSFIGRPGFPFVEELQRLMLRVREAGLDEIYYEWTCGMYRVPSNLPEIRSEPRLFHSITLQQLQVAFGLLSLGQIISLFIFIVEVWKAGRNHKGQN